MDIWEKRFKWLAIQHWVEGEVPDNLNVDYSCHDEYMKEIVRAVDAAIEEETPELSAKTNTICLCCKDDYNEIAQETFVGGVCADCIDSHSLAELLEIVTQ